MGKKLALRDDGWLRLASHLGMSLAQCRVEVSYREYLVWRAWLALELDRPSRTDHYLMQVAYEVRRANARRPRSVKLDHFRLRSKNGTATTPGPAMSVEMATALSKASWMARVSQSGPRPPGAK